MGFTFNSLREVKGFKCWEIISNDRISIGRQINILLSL